MGFPQVGDGELRIAPEALQVFMTEKRLDVVEVRAAPDQLGGAASPEAVDCDMLLQFCVPLMCYALRGRTT